MDDNLLLRYSRHIMLDEIGEAGQQRLAAARVLVVGVGGLGSPAAMYLAAAGVGELILADDDVVDLTNLQRQLLHSTETIGWKKTDSAIAHLARVNPHCRTRAHGRVHADNVDALLQQAEVVVDCSDNFATRHLLNRACVRHGKPLVFGAAIGFDAQVTVFDVRREESPCYNCLFSEETPAQDTRCALLGVFAPLVGMVGAMQAAEALRCIVSGGSALVGRLLLLDARGMHWREVHLPRDMHCKVCDAR